MELTRREMQITEYVAWGAAQKEIASMLFIDNDTVANHLKNIYRKLNITKATELAAWYFCSHYNIPLTMSPIKKKICSAILLLILLPSEIYAHHQMIRAKTVKTLRSSTRARSRSRRNELDLTTYF